jgi:diguanylate cyclase (GGDEF)-like protein/PAS domain S-box-containing protein
VTPLSIKSKVTLVATASFLALLALVSAIQIYLFKVQMLRLLEVQQLTLVTRVADDIDQKLQVRINALTGVAKIVPPEAFSKPQAMRKILEGQPALFAQFDSIGTVSPSGEIVAALPYDARRAAVNISDRPWIKEALVTGRTVISAPHVSRSQGRPQVVLLVPVFDGRGQVAGLLTGTLDLFQPNFLGNIGKTTVGKTGSFALFTRERMIVMSADKERIMTPGPAPGVSPYFDRATSGVEGVEENINSRGLRALFAYKNLQTVPWVLVAALPVEEAYAPISTAQRRIVEVALVVALLLAPLIWLGVRSLLEPLVTLHDTIRRIRENPSEIPPPKAQRRDEIGELVNDFHELMEERKCAEDALKLSERRLQAISDNVPALIGYIDAERRFRFNNRTYENWLRMNRNEMLGREVREVIGEDLYEIVRPYMDKALAGEKVTFEFERTRGYSSRHFRPVYVPDIGPNNEILGIFVLVTDITDQKIAEQELVQLARFDALTNLPNRNTFNDRMTQALARAKRHDSMLALMYLDIDNFKTINDQYGHAMGDAVLKEFAKRLTHCVRATDTVARVSGDEFLIIVEDLDKLDSVRQIAEKILAAMHPAFVLESRELAVATSIGIAYCRAGASDADQLIRQADTAMYKAKRSGGNVYCLHSPGDEKIQAA